MTRIRKFVITILLCIPLLSLSIPIQPVSAKSAIADLSFIILSQYSATANIGEEILLFAVTSNGKFPTWKSSNSKVASVNTYGVVTAKKAGTAVITAKIKNAEAACRITVNKTKVTINLTSASIEHGETLKLTAKSSNGSQIVWKSSKKSIAVIDDKGTVTGLKPGDTVITAKADDTSVTCNLKVKSPSVKLSNSSVKLYRGHSVQITAFVSSKIAPTWKTNKKSVALVDENGTITGIKNGIAVITATVDGVIKTCNVTVLKPEITLSLKELTLKKGADATITASVSSGNEPVWSTSNPNIIAISSKGKITALEKGTAYVYASEDGTKVRCSVKVTN
ncbi:Ig-like domain-containing protein [Anaerocolumna sp. AGMB13025]|uniref:Ig-like domain-containing protein n=1 Tax=Anaerocolumna sp. AGMB13025 TaxID=3039116 RepID=UPI00241E5324|nr:Ig-like domain-containing protein [Anaerocolumna sp. AGMB13025]WFR59263.1 Ig-like domain-containing protein [Anaerocolumna sp. AGMB13025]